jgi:hypothetical protein
VGYRRIAADDERVVLVSTAHQHHRIDLDEGLDSRDRQRWRGGRRAFPRASSSTPGCAAAGERRPTGDHRGAEHEGDRVGAGGHGVGHALDRFRAHVPDVGGGQLTTVQRLRVHPRQVDDDPAGDTGFLDPQECTCQCRIQLVAGIGHHHKRHLLGGYTVAVDLRPVPPQRQQHAHEVDRVVGVGQGCSDTARRARSAPRTAGHDLDRLRRRRWWPMRRARAAQWVRGPRPLRVRLVELVGDGHVTALAGPVHPAEHAVLAVADLHHLDRRIGIERPLRRFLDQAPDRRV